MIDLDKILELEARATQSPWKAFTDNDDGSLSLNEIYYSIRPEILISNVSDVDDTENGSVIICAEDLELIATMRNNIRQICLELKAAREYFSRYKEAEEMYTQGDTMGFGNAWQDCVDLKKKYYEVANGKG